MSDDTIGWALERNVKAVELRPAAWRGTAFTAAQG